MPPAGALRARAPRGQAEEEEQEGRQDKRAAAAVSGAKQQHQQHRGGGGPGARALIAAAASSLWRAGASGGGGGGGGGLDEERKAAGGREQTTPTPAAPTPTATTTTTVDDIFARAFGDMLGLQSSASGLSAGSGFGAWGEEEEASAGAPPLPPPLPPPPLSTTNHQPAAEAAAGLTLIERIGAGSYGEVYKATWQGAVVAVKVVKTAIGSGGPPEHGGDAASAAEARRRHERECRLAARLRHPHVVQLYASYTALVHDDDDDDSPPSSSSSQSLVSHLVMEFCDRGSLATALRRDLFAPPPPGPSHSSSCPSSSSAASRWAAVLATAREVASALCYLHGPAGARMAHGDVQPGNVLLRGTSRGGRRQGDGGRGFVALLGDFGQSAPLLDEEGWGSAGGGGGERRDGAAPLMAGALSHAPPEGVDCGGGGQGVATAAGDVFAFGTLLWELAVGRCAFHGLSPAELLAEKVRGGGGGGGERPGPSAEERLLLPALLALGSSGGGGNLPAGLVDLVRACWSRDPADRPTAGEALACVGHMLEAVAAGGGGGG